MSNPRSTRWLVGGLIAIGASLLAAPIGPTVTSLDDLRALTPGASIDASSSVELDGVGERAIDPLLPSAASPALDPDRIGGSGMPLEMGVAALEQIDYPWATMLPSWTIEFTGPNVDLFGLTHTREERIEIFVRPGQTTEQLAHVIAHELGHAVDVTLNDGDDRRAWQDARAVGQAEWWPGSGTTDFATGAGDFAESFAAWQVGDNGFRSEIGDPPTPEQLNLLIDLAADR